MLKANHPSSFIRWRIAAIVFCLLVYPGLSFVAYAQTLGYDRKQGSIILGAIKEDLRKNYYDPNFRGVDVEGLFKQADEKIKEAKSTNEIFGIIAQLLIGFNDSHTFFVPPRRAARIEHGWQMQMIGDKCYVTAVQPGSDAEAKGLAPGDRVIGLEGFKFTRADLWKLQYIFYLLAPRPSLHVSIIKPDGQQRQLEIAAKVHQGKILSSLIAGHDRDDLIREAEAEERLRRHRYYEMGSECLIWKMPNFELTQRQIDEIIDKASRRKALILDLRGNGGGAEESLLRLTGNLFDHDVKIGDLKRRQEVKPLVAKTRGEHSFNGQLVVLVDGDSGSAAEVLARVVQLEKRGTVLGDRTAGAVMRSKYYDHQIGSEMVLSYGMSVTDADVVMSDGKSLEHTGVTPDESLLPTAADMAAKRDPVLARAAQLVGLKIEPEKAGALFPVEWRK